jgi:hypothetical protein
MCSAVSFNSFGAVRGKTLKLCVEHRPFVAKLVYHHGIGCHDTGQLCPMLHHRQL